MTSERGVSKKPAFLAAYTKCASVTKAAKAAKIDRSLVYRWIVEDPDFAKTFIAARLEAGELLEDEAVRRAYAGLDEPVIYQGGLCYGIDAFENELDADGQPTGGKKLKKNAKPLTVRKYSDALLMKLMDGFLPERYKKRSNVEVTGANGGPIALEAEKLKTLSDDELATLATLARKISGEERPS